MYLVCGKVYPTRNLLIDMRGGGLSTNFGVFPLFYYSQKNENLQQLIEIKTKKQLEA